MKFSIVAVAAVNPTAITKKGFATKQPSPLPFCNGLCRCSGSGTHVVSPSCVGHTLALDIYSNISLHSKTIELFSLTFLPNWDSAMACHFHWLHLAPWQILYYVATTNAFCEGLESEDQACQHPQGGGGGGRVCLWWCMHLKKNSLKQIHDGQTWHLSNHLLQLSWHRWNHW